MKTRGKPRVLREDVASFSIVMYLAKLDEELAPFWLSQFPNVDWLFQLLADRQPSDAVQCANKTASKLGLLQREVGSSVIPCRSLSRSLNRPWPVNICVTGLLVICSSRLCFRLRNRPNQALAFARISSCHFTCSRQVKIHSTAERGMLSSTSTALSPAIEASELPVRCF